MARQSTGGSIARQGKKRSAAQMPAEKPVDKEARKHAAAQLPAEEPETQQAMVFLKENGVSKAGYEPVLEAVKHPLSGLPQETRDMLLAILPWSIAVPADKRHAAQQAAVRMVDGVVDTVQGELQQALDVETGNVDELKATGAELEGAAERAEVSCDEACCAVEGRGKELAEAAATLLQKREALQEAERVEARLSVELEETRSLVLELEQVLSGSFRRLKDGDYEDIEVDDLAQTVMVAGAKSCLEEALVATLPTTLAKRERGAFGQTVLLQAEQGIRGKIAALNEMAELATAPVATSTAAAQAARAAFDAAVADQAQAANKLCSAQAASSEAAVAAVTAKASAATLSAMLPPALAAQNMRQEELDHFRTYNAFLFTLLRDRMSSKEPAGEEAGTGLPAAMAGA